MIGSAHSFVLLRIFNIKGQGMKLGCKLSFSNCDGIASLGNMQISNSKLCKSRKCWVYSAVNHPLWMSMLFHRRGFCGSARLFVTFGGCGGIMTTARPELPYLCSPQAKTRDESSRRGK